MIWVPIFFLCFALPLTAWHRFVLTPLQRLYFTAFAWNETQGGPGGTKLSGIVKTAYKPAPRRRPEIAHDGDVVSAADTGNPALPMKLSPEAHAQGWTELTLLSQYFGPDQYRPFLEEQFFNGRNLAQWLFTPLLFGAASFALLFATRAKMGFQTEDEERHGRRTKGPELVSALQWKLPGKAGGIRFRLQGRLGLPGPGLRIPRALESSHVLLMGDTGSGKSNAIRQILRQVEERGGDGGGLRSGGRVRG